MADSLPESELNQQSLESDDEKFNASLMSIGDIGQEGASPKVSSVSVSGPSVRQDSSRIPEITTPPSPGSPKLGLLADASGAVTNRADDSLTRQSASALGGTGFLDAGGRTPPLTPHPTLGSNDRQTPVQSTDRSASGTNPESKPISVERQQGAEAKSVGYPAEPGKSSQASSAEPNRAFGAGDEGLLKRPPAMTVHSPDTNHYHDRPTGSESGSSKAGGPNNRVDSGAGKVESELHRSEKPDSSLTRIDKPDYRSANEPLGLKGDELLNYALRRPNAAIASGTLEGRSGTLEGRSGTLEGRSGTLEGRSGTLEGKSGPPDAKADPAHQALPKSDLKAAVADNAVKRADPAEKGHFVSDAGGKSVGGDKPLPELEAAKGKASQRPEMVRLPEGSRGADGPLAAIIKQPRGMRGVLDHLEQLNGKLQPGFKIDRGENGVKGEGSKFGSGPKISGIAVVADLTERMKGWRKRPDIDSIDVSDAKPIGGKSARRPQWNAADEKIGSGVEGKPQAGRPQGGKPLLGLDGKLQPVSKSDSGAKGEFGSGPRFTVSAFGFRPEKSDGVKEQGERRAKDSSGSKKESTVSDTRVPLPGKGGVAGVIAGGIESIKEGFRFVRDSLVGSITDRSAGAAGGRRTEVFLGFAGRSQERSADATLKVPPEIKSKLPPPGGSVNVPGLVAVLLPFGGRGIRVTSDVSIAANEELRPAGKSKPSQGQKPESIEAGSNPVAPKSPLDAVAPSISAAGSDRSGLVASQSGAVDDNKTVFSTKPDLPFALDGSVPARRPFIRLHLPDGTYGGKSVDKSHKVPAIEPKPAQESETVALRAVSKSEGLGSPAVPKAEIEGSSTVPMEEVVDLSAVPESRSASLPSVPESETLGSSEVSKSADSDADIATRELGKRYVNPAFDELEETWSSDDDEARDSELRPGEVADNSAHASSTLGAQALAGVANNYLYLVKPGDSVESVARLELKDPALAPLVFRKNKQHVLPEVEYGVHPLSPGVFIELPTPAEIADFRGAGS